MKLDGKVALITGAASGIGHAIARRYVEAGGKVVIADLNADGAAKAANELGDTKTAIRIAMDVSKRIRSMPGSSRRSKPSAGSTSSYPMLESRSWSDPLQGTSPAGLADSRVRQVRFGSLDDITAGSRHVRFTPDSGHSSVQVGCSKSAISGHCSLIRMYPP
jgi:NAD(P)-dependent dehydrogenase (short-subunit alcohol dehydrogenase family)